MNLRESGMHSRLRIGSGLVLMAATFGCGKAPEPGSDAVATSPPAASYQVKDTTITATFDATGVAEPLQRSTLSTRIMGNVIEVLVHEGDKVGAGQTLVRLDAREVDSRRAQLEAGLQAAQAVYRDATTQAERFRGLYRDSAATRYQLDQAETGLARAEAGLKTAEAGLRELNAVGSYAEIRAPFAGVITRRMADPGGFAAPGTPLVEIQDPSRLRVAVSVPPTVGASLHRGSSVAITIEGKRASGQVEGVVPSPAGTVYQVNVLVDNRGSSYLVGGAAVVAIPTGTRRAILIPARAVIREGDLTGVRVVAGGRSELRWVRLGQSFPGASSASGSEPLVEILSGLSAGDAVAQGES